MKRIFVGALLLLLLVSGIGMGAAEPIGEGRIEACVVVIGFADFFMFGSEPIVLLVHPLYNTVSNAANWGLISNRLGMLGIDFQSIGSDSGGIPAWAEELFEYRATAGTWSGGFVFEGEYTPFPDVEANFHPNEGAEMSVGAIVYPIMEEPIPVSAGVVLGQIQMAFTVPGVEGEHWELPSGYTWLDLGNRDDENMMSQYGLIGLAFYHDIIQVTIYER